MNPDGTGYTVGDTITPVAPYSTPSSSNCVTTATVSNGIAHNLLGGTGGAASSGPAATGSSATGTLSPGSFFRGRVLIESVLHQQLRVEIPVRLQVAATVIAAAAAAATATAIQTVVAPRHKGKSIPWLLSSQSSRGLLPLFSSIN